MIERQFVEKKMKEFQIQEFIAENLKRVGHSHTTLSRTPLGEKIVIHASKPGLIVGRKGQNIKKLTKTLKVRFNLDNPQIEIAEVDDPNLDASIVAERIANSLERFGSARFKGVGHKSMSDIMSAGALGVEILISGKIPSSRAKRWRFYQGYLKKSGDVAITGVKRAYASAKLKTGIVGIQVRIMPPDIVLPDRIELMPEPITIITEESESKTQEPELKPKEEKKQRKKPKKEGSQKRSRKKASDAEQKYEASEASSTSAVSEESAQLKSEGGENESQGN